MPRINPLPGLVRVNGRYWYQPPVKDGIRPHRISLRTSDPTEAADRYQAIIDAGPHVPTPAEARRASLLGILETYLADRLATGSHRSRVSGQATTTAVRLLAKVAGDIKPANVTQAHILAVRANLTKAKRSPETVRTYLAALHGFFTWCVKRRLLLIHPVKGIPIGQPARRTSQHAITRQERDKLLALALTQRPKLLPVLILGFHCGLRIGEIIAARKNWLTFSPTGGVLTVRQGEDFRVKNDHGRKIPLDRVAILHLKKLSARLKPDDFLVAPWKKTQGKHRLRWDPRRSFKWLAEQAGVPALSPHNMRHTFASLHAQAGTPLFKVAQWLGDSVAVVERHYAALQAFDPDIHRTVD